MKRVIFTSALLISLSISYAPAYCADGKAVYEKVCSACHKTGVLNAPVLGNKKLWAPHIAEGTATLYKHAIEGHDTMPAKGGDKTLSDAEVKAAVDYIVKESK